MSQARALCILFASVALAACDHQPAASPAASGNPAACDDFASKICLAAGEGSEACASVKSTAAILSPAACDTALAEAELSIAKIQAQRAPCRDLVEKLCAELGAGTDTCAMVREKTPELPAEHCQRMLGDFPQVLAELKQREKANQPLDAAQQKLLASGAPAFGPEDAKVTVIEFSDFQCPYCSQAAQVTKQIKEKYGTKVRFVFRNFPLSFHPEAHLAAQATLAANAQGKFWELHDLLFANQQKLDRASIEAHAGSLGLDVAALKRALDQGTYKAAVDADVALGEGVAVDGTPTLFINGKRVRNPTDFASVSAAIEAGLGAN